MGSKKVSYGNLPEPGDAIGVYMAELDHLPFEAIVAGRRPLNTKKATEGLLPNQDSMVIEEAMFTLSYVPSGFLNTIRHTKSGWEMLNKNSWTTTSVRVEIIE